MRRTRTAVDSNRIDSLGAWRGRLTIARFISRHVAVGIVGLVAIGLVSVESSGGRTLGQTLRPVESGVTASLRGVSVVDSRIVWASGAEGTVLRSLDGGRNWERRPVAGHDRTDFRDIQAFDAERAVILAAGAPPVILLTDDGGATWSERFRHPDPEAFLDAFAFDARGRGIALADPIEERFELLETTDAGRTWHRWDAERKPAAGSGEHAYAASGSIVALDDDGTIRLGLGGPNPESSDASCRVLRLGRDETMWRTEPVPMPGGESAGIFSIVRIDERRAVVVGGDYRLPDRAEGTAAWTDDGGDVWQVPEQGLGGYRSAVAVRRSGEAIELIATGPTGTDRSRDGGKSWHPLSELGYHAFAFAPDGSLGIAVGSEGRIARLTDHD
ncbi:MAG TPA: oxidoreductase [Planctomycetaceae bacterium]|nr:oxidoreductase [Planctomycetaceae bacterium]HRF00753.1 YCF48-related protein [Pirellulaceae bacterium]